MKVLIEVNESRLEKCIIPDCVLYAEAMCCSSPSGCSMTRSWRRLSVSTAVSRRSSSSATLSITCWWLTLRWCVTWSSSSTTWSLHPWPRWCCPSSSSSGPCCRCPGPASASGWRPSSTRRCGISDWVLKSPWGALGQNNVPCPCYMC